MKAVVLVGGEGTRLRPLTYRLPKQMLPIVERPMIERVLAHLGGHGIDEAVLSLQYLPDRFIEAYPDDVAAGVRLSYATEPEPLDTAGAVRFAAEQAGIDGTFVVVNGDVLTDLDLGALIAFHRDRGAEGTIRLYPVDDPSRFGVVTTDAEGRVGEFIEKPPAEAAPSNLINAGTYVFEPSFLGRVPLGVRTSIERVTFPEMAAEGRLFAMAEPSYWLDTGTPAAFLRANFDLLEGRRPGPPCPGSVRGDDGVWRLGSGSVRGAVFPPAFVGDEADVAAGARVERSVLGSGVVVEAGASVRGSVLLAGVSVGAGARVEGAILGSGARVGAECEVRAGSVIGFEVELEPGRVVDGERVPA
ncbi:MAG: sugar phosphate nucleotidyltransferase [Acidimicrobiales bacterium]